VPSPPIPPSASTPSSSSTSVKCNATNTPNIYYDKEMGCNWIYNKDKKSFECIKQNCEWVFNSSSCSWSCVTVCPVPTVPSVSPSAATPAVKANCTCEGNRAKIDVIDYVLGISNSTLKNKSFGKTIDSINGDITNLYGWIQDIYHWLDISFNQIQALQNKTSGFNSTSEIVATVRNDVIANGLFLG